MKVSRSYGSSLYEGIAFATTMMKRRECGRSQGLSRAYDILTRMQIPTDWLWRDLAAQAKFAVLTPPVARHDGETTYIGNEHRGVEREFII